MAEQRARETAQTILSRIADGRTVADIDAQTVATAYLALEAEYDSLRSVCARAKEECAKQEDKIAALEAEREESQQFRSCLCTKYRERIAELEEALGDLLGCIRSDPTMDGSERPMGLVDFRRVVPVLKRARTAISGGKGQEKEHG